MRDDEVMGGGSFCCCFGFGCCDLGALEPPVAEVSAGCGGAFACFCCCFWGCWGLLPGCCLRPSGLVGFRAGALPGCCCCCWVWCCCCSAGGLIPNTAPATDAMAPGMPSKPGRSVVVVCGAGAVASASAWLPSCMLTPKNCPASFRDLLLLRAGAGGAGTTAAAAAASAIEVRA